jgi:hypothetical protein
MKSVGVARLEKFRASVPPLRFRPPVKVCRPEPSSVRVPTPVLVSPADPEMMVSVLLPMAADSGMVVRSLLTRMTPVPPRRIAPPPAPLMVALPLRKVRLLASCALSRVTA